MFFEMIFGYIKCRHISYVIPFRQICASSRTFSKKSETEKESPATIDILDELKEEELSEEEIQRKRFKSRLPERVYRIFVQKEAVPIEAKYDFTMKRLQSYYARHGKDSKLNPGICWPTKEEILETIKYDKIFEPPLQELMKKVEVARSAEEKRKKEVEAEVDRNMANLDKWMAEYYAKIEKKEQQAIELKQKREQQIDAVSEYLGYEINPKDPRFQEAVEQMKKDEKKALKVKKQKESYDKMIAKLKEMAESK
ncbi:Growth arrest and DNA damage-inducible proteins-interacting protein 1, partial [Stegodyphus mimosarum]